MRVLTDRHTHTETARTDYITSIADTGGKYPYSQSGTLSRTNHLINAEIPYQTDSAGKSAGNPVSNGCRKCQKLNGCGLYYNILHYNIITFFLRVYSNRSSQYRDNHYQFRRGLVLTIFCRTGEVFEKRMICNINYNILVDSL